MRQREDFKEGTLGADLLTTVTTIDFGSDPGFATIAAPDYAAIIIDPEGAGNGPEIVYLTAFTATQTTGTITRGEEGTSDPGVTHASGTAWRHGPTIEDFDRFVWAWDSDDPSGVAQVDIDLAGFESVEIIGWVKPATDNVTLAVRLSNNGGASFRSGGSDYVWINRNSSITQTYTGGDAADSEGEVVGTIGNASGEFVSFTMKIVGLASSGVRTFMTTQFMTINFNGTHFFGTAGMIVTTEEVNDYLRLFFSSGNIASGRIAVYGYPTP